jgi:hypothetical protein
MFTSSLNFYDRAVEWATTHGKPIVANCDVHRLHQLGSTYSLIDAPPDAGAICEADCGGARAVEAKPLSWKDAALTMAELLAADVGRLFRRLPLERVRQLHEKLPAARS